LAAFISLEEPAAAWSEKILTARHDSRQDMTKVIADAGFDAKTVAADLQEFYLRAAKPDEKEAL
jgi:hypothetical protein